MKDEYIPNEKYRNMFGVERSGYGCERVDLYLAQLEVAFKKIREDNRSLKHALEQAAPGAQAQGFSLVQPPAPELAAQLEQQGQYLLQLQAQLAEQQELSRRLSAQLQQPGAVADPQTIEALMAQLAALRAEADALRQQLQRPAADPQVIEDLMTQLAALRGEADFLRQQLRQQAAAPVIQLSQEEQQGLIGRVLVEARAQAEEMVRAARQEADEVTARARRRVDELRAEQERVHSQLQGISYGLRNLLGAGTEYQQRGEELAAS